MTIDEMKKRKIELGLSYEMIAKMAGLPLGTVQKIFSGITKAPRKATIDALTKVLSPASERPVSYTGFTSASYIKEPAPIYGTNSAVKQSAESADPRQGTYTIDDYMALPDERRVEIIDGYIYDMASPTPLHQILVGALYSLFDECAAGHGYNCAVFMAPSDVRLGNDNRTVVQPDVYVVCRKEAESQPSGKLKTDKYGLLLASPDLVIEVLSPSTRSRDMILKYSKYHSSGVKEYWIVDPKNRIVITYDFRDDTLIPQKYTFEDEIPVAVSDNLCKIDFKRISRKLEKLDWIDQAY